MRRPQRVLAVLAASLVALTAAFVAQASAAASTNFSQADSVRQQLSIDLLAAAANGYTDQDLGSIIDRQLALNKEVAPTGTSAGALYIRSQALALARTRLESTTLEQTLPDPLQMANTTRVSRCRGWHARSH